MTESAKLERNVERLPNSQLVEEKYVVVIQAEGFAQVVPMRSCLKREQLGLWFQETMAAGKPISLDPDDSRCTLVVMPAPGMMIVVYEAEWFDKIQRQQQLARDLLPGQQRNGGRRS
jgi:hypothetical protein